MIKSSHGFPNTLLSEQNAPHFADNIFKYLFWIKMLVFSIKFHWSLIIGILLAISQHWYSQWLCTSSAPCHKPMVIYDIVNIIGPLFTHFGLVSCLCLSQWPLPFLIMLMTPSDWTMSCHVLITDDGRGWKHHRGTYKFLCRMDNFSGIYFNYIDINYIYKRTYFFIWHSERCLSNW